jgi:hypothetical protein
MSSPIEPNTTGVPILDATKASPEQITANDMRQAIAEKDNQHIKNDIISEEAQYCLDRLRDLSITRLELLEHCRCDDGDRINVLYSAIREHSLLPVPPFTNHSISRAAQISFMAYFLKLLPSLFL